MTDPNKLRELHGYINKMRDAPIDLRPGAVPEEKPYLRQVAATPAWEEGESLRVPIGLEKVRADGKRVILAANSPIGGGDAFIEEVPVDKVPR